MESTVTLEVGGQLFPVHSETVENGPCSRLTTLYNAGLSQGKSERLSVNRPAESFAAILAFYQTGELHIPMTSCPGAFLIELEFWEISPEILSGCCYHRLQSFLNEQETVRIFKKKQKKNEDNVKSAKSVNCFQKIRAKIWETIDYTKPTVPGKVYLVLNVVMVLASIFTLALSTDPIFKRTMTNCERLEYMVSTGAEGYEIIRPYLEELCGDTDVPQFTAELMTKLNRSEMFKLLRGEDGKKDKDFLTFKFAIPRIRKTQTGMKTSVTSTPRPPRKKIPTFDIQILKNESTTHKSKSNNFSERLRPAPPLLLSNAVVDTEYVTVPNLKTRILSLSISEAITTIFFTIELILRLSSCPRLKIYFLSIINAADAVSLIGAYLYIIFYMINPSLRYGSWIDYLAYLQMLRSLRLFRVVLNIRAGKVLIHSLCQNVKDLFILVFFLLAGMCTFASCIYIVEEDNPNIQSIPDAWYVSIITMTTVGYGDLHPETKIGRFLCCLCAIAGVLLLALTVPIFANHFLVLYNHAESDDVIEKYLEKGKEKQKLNRTINNKKEMKCETHSI